MEMTGETEIQADPATVYAALLDPEMLRACVPGATAVDGNPDDGYTASVTQKVGPVKATFKGRVEMSDLVDDRSLRITGEGKGGAAGFAKGGAAVTLAATATGTLLTYEVEAKVGGKLAQLGSRLIDGFAKKMAGQFFANLQEQLAPEPTETPDVTDDAVDPDTDKKGWLKKLTGRD